MSVLYIDLLTSSVEHDGSQGDAADEDCGAEDYKSDNWYHKVATRRSVKLGWKFLCKIIV